MTLSDYHGSPDCVSMPSDSCMLTNLPINEEDEGCLSPPKPQPQQPQKVLAKTSKSKVIVVVGPGSGDSKLDPSHPSLKSKEVQATKSQGKVKIERVPKGVKDIKQQVFGDKDLLQLEARTLLAKKLNELANNRLDIWEKRQKFVRQKSFDLESDIESENDAIVRYHPYISKPIIFEEILSSLNFCNFFSFLAKSINTKHNKA